MFMNVLKRVVGLGLALCIAGALVIPVPVAVSADDITIAPFGIVDPDEENDY